MRLNTIIFSQVRNTGLCLNEIRRSMDNFFHRFIGFRPIAEVQIQIIHTQPFHRLIRSFKYLFGMQSVLRSLGVTNNPSQDLA